MFKLCSEYNTPDNRSRQTGEDYEVSTTQETAPDSSPNRLAKYTMAVTVMMTGVAATRSASLKSTVFANQPDRSKQRLYTEEDIELIRKIAHLEKNGVNLPGIKVILEMQKAMTVKEF